MADIHTAAVLLNIYTLAIGFSVAAVCASAAPLITGKPLRFEMPAGQSDLSMIGGCCCRIIAGPFLIFRNTIMALFKARSEPYWVMMAIILSALWSFCQGVIIVETACGLGACSL